MSLNTEANTTADGSGPRLCVTSFASIESNFWNISGVADFPKPTRISRVIRVWNVSEVAYWLKRNKRNRRAEDYIAKVENEIHVKAIVNIPILMKKATLARYIGITAPVMELLVKRGNGFPKGVKAFASVPQYCVCDVNDWMFSNRVENPRRLVFF